MTFTFGGFAYNDGATYRLKEGTFRATPVFTELLEQVGRADREVSLGGYFGRRAFSFTVDVNGTSPANCETNLRTLMTNFSPRKGYQQFYGSFLGDGYLNARCIALAPLFSKPAGEWYIPTTITMLAPDGMRYATAPTTLTPALTFVHLTGTEYKAAFTLATAGSEVALPVYSLTLTGSAYTIGSAWLYNVTTGQTITILASFAPGDVIAVDTANSVVTKNGVALTAPFYGIVPTLDPTLGATNSYELHLLATGSAPTATASVTFSARFLD